MWRIGYDLARAYLLVDLNLALGWFYSFLHQSLGVSRCSSTHLIIRAVSTYLSVHPIHKALTEPIQTNTSFCKIDSL